MQPETPINGVWRALLLVGLLGLSCGAAEAPKPSRIDALPHSLTDQFAALRQTSAPASDPVEPIARNMHYVAIDLGAPRTDQPVQTEQKQVISQLDQLIAALEKQCKGNGGGSANPTKPMASSVLAKGPGGSGPMHDAQSGTRVWGQLPPKQREQILQSQTEGFPAGYESVLATYYSRLSQGQVPSDAAGHGGEPTTRPAAP
jgi:hypothetical protein